MNVSEFFPMWEKLTPPQRRRLEESAAWRRTPAGTVLRRGGDDCLGLLLVADRELSLVYLFFGWYPVLRPRLQRIRPALLRAGAKLGIYLVTTALLWGGAAWVVGLPEQSAVPTAAVMTVLGCGLFFCADRCFAMFSSLWRTRLRRRFFKG